MAVDAFLKIQDVPGESQDKDHPNEIDVLSWSWGLSQTGTFHMGGGGGAGKVNAHDLSFVKYCDKASPPLMQCCCNGQHLKSATLTLRKAGKQPLEYLKFDFEDLLVTSYQTGGGGGDERQNESITLNFAKVKAKYKQQKPDGTGVAAGDMGWDVQKNAEWK